MLHNHGCCPSPALPLAPGLLPAVVLCALGGWEGLAVALHPVQRPAGPPHGGYLGQMQSNPEVQPEMSCCQDVR